MIFTECSQISFDISCRNQIDMLFYYSPSAPNVFKNLYPRRFIALFSGAGDYMRKYKKDYAPFAFVAHNPF